MSLFSNVNGYGNGGYGYYPLGGGKKTEEQTKVETAKETIDVKKSGAPEGTAKTDGRGALTPTTTYFPNVAFTGGVSPTIASLENPNSVVLKSFDTAYERGDFGNGAGVTPEFAAGWKAVSTYLNVYTERGAEIEKGIMANWA